MAKVFEKEFPKGSFANQESDGYYLHKTLKENLDQVIPRVKKDWDMCWCCDGVEGGGKSTFISQIAKYCDHTFCAERMIQTPEQFDEIIKAIDNFKAVVLDEGFLLNSRASMTALNRKLLTTLSQCRQKNLFIFIIIPSFFDLDKNIALWRSRGLYHIEAPQLNRGFFKYYNWEAKKMLYVSGKQYYYYGKVKPNFEGKFTDFMPLDKELYLQMKKEAFEKSAIEPKYEKHKAQRDCCFKIMRDGLGVSEQKISDCLGEFGFKISQKGINDAIHSLENYSL